MKAMGNAERRSAENRSGQTGRWVGFAVAFLGILLVVSMNLRAQGVRYDNIVLGPRGGPVASAKVAVCAAGATTSTTPCSPLATVYSDEALTKPMANPFQVDSLGNYGFWAAPGHYVVQIYGSGVTSRVMNVFLPCDPSDCSMASASISSITAGTLNLTGSLTVNGRAVATEPEPDDAVMYVSPNGNDSASGMSWGSAKQTLYAAVVANQAEGGGTIFVAPNTACGGPVSGQGLWLTGYASPPTGWIQVSHPMKIVGVGASSVTSQNAPAPGVLVNCGSTGSNTPLWISGTTWVANLEFDNLIFSSNANHALELGISPTGDATASNANDIVFRNDSFHIPNASTGGPTIEMGNNVFWVRFYDTGIDANADAAALSDAHEGVVVNPNPTGTQTNVGSSGLLFFYNTVINNGGIRFYGNGTNGGSLVVKDLTTESQNDGSAAVWITDDQALGNYRVANVTVADATVTPTYAVKLDGTAATPGVLVVSNANGDGQDYSGPMTLLGGNSDSFGQITSESPLQQEQQGFEWGSVWSPYFNDGFADFGLKNAPWPNLVSWSPNIPSESGVNWTNETGGTLTQVTAPDGTQNAWETPSTVSGGISFYAHTLGVTAGDYFIAGGWAKSATYEYPFNLNSNTTGCVQSISQPSVGNGITKRYNGSGWQWSFEVLKVLLTENCQINFSSGGANASQAYFAPFLIHIPASSGFTDSGVLNLAANIGQFPSLSQAGVVSTLAGHPIAFGGSGDNYFAILDHNALTSNQTFDFPNASGTIALAGANGVSAGTITLSGGSGSHTFAKPYGAAPVCTASDTTGAAAVKVTSSATAVSISGTGTDVVAWICSPTTN